MAKSVTSKEYWDQYWGEGDIKHPNYDASQGLFYSYRLLLEECFEHTRQRLNVERLQIMDCGCGEGLMLRFMVEQFANIDAYGIEYSDAIHKAERMASELGHTFNLVHGDLFQDWAPEYRERFDVVLSVGLIEHFERPGEVLAQMEKILKPGGALITIIPNFNGVFNFLWKLYDKKNYAYHVPIRHNEFIDLHRELGLLDVTFYSLGMPVIPGVNNPSTAIERTIRQTVIYINGYLVQRIFPRRQESIHKCYPMVSVVACVGIK